jgi:hypothetical protein
VCSVFSVARLALAEQEADVERDHLVELERLVVPVDLLIGEVATGATALRVVSAAVPRKRERAVLDAERDDVIEVEREAEAERWRHGDASRALERGC